MKEYLKEHLFQFISLIPVCFIAIGSFVLNIYLNQYGIIDVALFDSKTVFVGFVAVFQFISFFLLICIYIGKEEYKDELDYWENRIYKQKSLTCSNFSHLIIGLKSIFNFCKKNAKIEFKLAN